VVGVNAFVASVNATVILMGKNMKGNTVIVIMLAVLGKAVFCVMAKEHALAVFVSAILCSQETTVHVRLKPILVSITASFQDRAWFVLVMEIVNVAGATAHL